MKKIRNFHAGGICGASGEGSGRIMLVIRSAPRRTARHGTADASVVVRTPTLNPDSENRGYRSRRRPRGPSNRQERGRRVAPIRHPDKKLRVANPRRAIKPTPLPLSHRMRNPAFLVARAPQFAASSAHAEAPQIRGGAQKGSRQFGSSRFPRVAPQSAGNTRWPSRRVTRESRPSTPSVRSRPRTG